MHLVLWYFFLGFTRSRGIAECIWWKMMCFVTWSLKWTGCVSIASTILSWKKEKKREKKYELLSERNIALPCWIVTTDYLWTSNSEKPKVRSGVESVDKSNVSEGVSIRDSARSRKVQGATCMRKWGRRAQIKLLNARLLNDTRWLPASDITRDATLRDSISAKTRNSIRDKTNYVSSKTNIVQTIFVIIKLKSCVPNFLILEIMHINSLLY